LSKSSGLSVSLHQWQRWKNNHFCFRPCFQLWTHAVSDAAAQRCSCMTKATFDNMFNVGTARIQWQCVKNDLPIRVCWLWSKLCLSLTTLDLVNVSCIMKYLFSVLLRENWQNTSLYRALHDVLIYTKIVKWFPFKVVNIFIVSHSYLVCGKNV
jgi:hypothetical protein